MISTGVFGSEFCNHENAAYTLRYNTLRYTKLLLTTQNQKSSWLGRESFQSRVVDRDFLYWWILYIEVSYRLLMSTKFWTRLTCRNNFLVIYPNVITENVKIFWSRLTQMPFIILHTSYFLFDLEAFFFENNYFLFNFGRFLLEI